MEEQLSNLLAHLRRIRFRDDQGATRSAHLEEACRDIEEIISALRDPNGRRERLHLKLCDALIHLSKAGFLELADADPSSSSGETTPAPVKLTPEILEWARQQSTEEEILAGIRDIRETGGLELRDFLHELEQAAGSNE